MHAVLYMWKCQDLWANLNYGELGSLHTRQVNQTLAETDSLDLIVHSRAVPYSLRYTPFLV